MNYDRIESHFALVLVSTIGADRQISPSEVENMESFLEGFLNGIKSSVKAKDLVAETFEEFKTRGVPELAAQATVSIGILKEAMQPATRQQFYRELLNIVTDAANPGTERFLGHLRKVWEVE